MFSTKSAHLIHKAGWFSISQIEIENYHEIARFRYKCRATDATKNKLTRISNNTTDEY